MIGKVLTLGVLYFVQGLPYGFQDKFLPMYLRSTGLSHTKLSLMKLLYIPWLCKPVFGPLIDLKWTKFLWLLLSLGFLTFISFCGIFINSDYFILMCSWLLSLNLLSAFQDVSVDALALFILQECEMGHANSAQVIGYKLGALFGGGILFWINHYYGWFYLCLSLTSLYLMAVVAFLPVFFQNLSDANKNSKSINKDKDKYENDLKQEFKFLTNKPTCKVENANADEKDYDLKLDYKIISGDEIPLNSESQNILDSSHVAKNALSIEESHENILRRRRNKSSSSGDIAEQIVSKDNSISQSKRFSICEIPQLVFTTKGTIPAIVFLLLYKLGERGALSTFPIFLVDQGISTKQIGFWSGIIGQSASLLGSICSGWIIAHKWDLRQFLNTVLLVRTVPIIMLWIIINLWFNSLPSFIHSILFFFSVASLIALEFTAGLVTTSVFTLMMTCSLKAPISLQATHYSVLSSVETAGKLLLSSVSGALIDWMGLSSVYFMFVVLSAPTVLILPFIEC